MKVRRLTTNGYVGLADGSHSLSDENGRAADVVVVTGPVASGKSSFLEAIALCAEDVARNGKPSERGNGRVRSDSVAAKLELTWELSSEEAVRVGSEQLELSSETILLWGPTTEPAFHNDSLVALFASYAHSSDVGKVELFGEEREIRGGGGRALLAESAQRSLRLSRDGYKYACVRAFLAYLALPAAEMNVEKTRARFDRSLTALGVTRRLVGANSDGKVYFASEGGDALELEELSRGDREAVLFASTASLVALDSSTILVDRPEQHMACDEVAQFVAGLRDLGKDNQIIIATGSRELVAMTAPGTIVRLGS